MPDTEQSELHLAMSSERSVAALILTYNQEAYIEACLESVANTDYPNMKIWVLDDGSTDATVSRIKDFIARTSQEICLIEQKNSGGHISANLQTLLDQSTGDYILFMSGDDMLGPAFPLRRTVSVLRTDPEISFVLPRSLMLTSDPLMVPPNIYRHGLLGLLEAGDPEKLRAKHLYHRISRINIQGMVVRRSVTQRIGGFDTDLIADDYAFVMRLFDDMVQTRQRFLFDPHSLWLYRLHDTNIHRVSRRQFALTTQVVAKYVPPKHWSSFAWDKMGLDSLEDWKWASDEANTLFGSEKGPLVMRQFASAAIKAARRRRDIRGLWAFTWMKGLRFKHHLYALFSLLCSLIR